mmetsp:Transcript_14782/g.26825  ORF Transcript_14782/g.26825 Transcript_14782/m.26825 type:complete len:268 (-) Transcript_14782:164-967(-)
MSDSKESRDQDCASLARAALFPLQVNRDGTHPTLFPASEALRKMRDDIMAKNPDRAPSSFFPRGVVVVRDLAHDTLYGHGQPDGDSRFDIIPRMLSARCTECGDEVPGNSFVQNHGDVGEKEIVLCTNRLLKRDYAPEKILDLPPKSLAAVEEALAHEVTRVADQLNFDREHRGTCEELAFSEIRAAAAAECYFGKHEREIKRGSSLPTGYSLFPTSLQTWARARCIRSVAVKATANSFGKVDSARCVNEAFDQTLEAEQAQKEIKR